MSRKPAKTQQSSTTKPRRNNAPTAARPASSTLADLQEQVGALTRELVEAREQQAASSEVLRVISSSATDVQRVFEMIGERAGKLCDAEISVVSMVDGELIRLVSINGMTEEGVEAARRVFPMRLDDETVTARAVRTCTTCHVPDVLGDPKYQNKETARTSGYRGCLGVPMVRDGQVVGAIFVARRQPGLFANAQVELLKTFADQAVVAIENVRLFDEVQARTRELTESLERQTATSEVLQVISSSPGELEPVFQAMLANATRICGAEFGNMFLREGDTFRAVAVHGPQPSYAERYRREPLLDPVKLRNTPLARVAGSKHVLNVLDLREDQSYAERNPNIVALVESAGARTILGVPMLKEDALIGAIFIYRLEVRPFTEKEIELVTNFAAQAIIAIENTRLLNELRQRTEDLSESLKQQTAMSEILRVISSSTIDVQPVFETIARSAVDLCGATYGMVFRYDGELLSVVAH
jgi:GAF domain-containing protein